MAKTPVSTTFARRGIVIALSLILLNYVFVALCYSYINPELLGNGIPHKFLLYIFLLTGIATAFLVVRQPLLEKEIADNITAFPDFPIYAGWAIAIQAFSIGTFILYNVAIGVINDHAVVYPFVNHNQYVADASNPFNIASTIILSILYVFIFQGFLFNGVSKITGILEANICTSLFIGFYFNDMIGEALFNFFLNYLFLRTRNIFYPALVSAGVSAVMLLLYYLKPDWWVIEADRPFYRSEAIKGLIIIAMVVPLIITLMKKMLRAFQKKEPENPAESAP
jgi:hypothetical protein